ncbi:MAG TPA: class I SAM-dependent methyltransferase [Gammaproteobacteria bacterium]|nr:class I SAM-dependent methyltransferase [Gammaproteobacteria bacterium]
MLSIAGQFPGRWLQGYVRGKLGSDPVYQAAAEIIRAHPAPVLDIGCGIGLLAHYLDSLNCKVDYLGIDLDAGKIRIAQQAASRHAHLRFLHASCDALPAWQGHVVILDVLHYLTADLQQNLLTAAAERVAPGASLIIRSVIRAASWRFAVTRLEEAFMRCVRWMRYRVQHYPDVAELETPLRNAGLLMELRPLWARTPFNSYLIVARRP